MCASVASAYQAGDSGEGQHEGQGNRRDVSTQGTLHTNRSVLDVIDVLVVIDVLDVLDVIDVIVWISEVWCTVVW